MKKHFENYWVFYIIGWIVILIYLFGVILPEQPFEIQSVNDLSTLDGEIQWYGDFHTWNTPNTSYPFVTRNFSVDWQDESNNLYPIELVGDIQSLQLVLDIELRGSGIYTEQQKSTFTPEQLGSPDFGNFKNFTWVWIDVPSGDYVEWIKLCWTINAKSLYLNREEITQREFCGQMVDSQSDNEGFYRVGEVNIPHIIYLPLVMKR